MVDDRHIEQDRIEAALALLLVAAIEHERQRPPATTIEILSLAELINRSPIESLLVDPVACALRLGVRNLGRRLHELGGTSAMRALLARVAELDPAHEGQCLSICDSAWDSIGSGRDWWVA